MPRQAHARIQRVITGKGKIARPIDAHERNVLAITRRIHTLERKARDLRQQITDTRSELKAKRRELRAVLQRDSSITEDAPILSVAGKADAVDATTHHAENRKAGA